MNTSPGTLDNLSRERRALLALRVSRLRNESVEQRERRTIPTLPRSEGANTFALSFAQERLWFLDQLVPGSSGYNMPTAVRLRGRLNVDALRKSFNEIVARHETLRTTFALSGGQPVQVIAPAMELPLTLIDLRQHENAEEEAHLQALKEAQTPFDLSSGPLLRTTLLQLANEDHVALLTMHHIVSDNWSMSVLVREMAVLYSAFATDQAGHLPELPIQYADYASWRREYLKGETLGEQLNYWRDQLHGALPVLELPADKQRPAVQSFRGDQQPLVLSRELSEELKAFSESEGVTLFMTLLAAFKVLLCRYTNQHDIIVGTPIANRNRRETEGLIGFFVDTLVLRSDLSGNPTFRELLVRVRDVALGAYAHQDLPFEKLVEALQVERDRSRQPVFQVMLTVHTAPQETPVLAGLTLSSFETSFAVETFEDLSLSFADTPSGLTGTLEYNTDLFERETIARFGKQFERLLWSIVSNPEQRVRELEILSKEERRQQLVQWNETGAEYPGEQCVQQLFEAQVGRTPAAVALVDGAEELSYRELNERANQLAHYLQRLGVGPEVLVGICMERSVEMLVSVLAVLKSGGAYLPLDPAYPAERVSFMLGDAAVAVLLTQAHLRERLPESEAVVVCLESEWELVAEEPRVNPESGVGADNLLYVIYTSGSTGRPKGVALPHRPIVNLLSWHERTLKRGARMLQFASLSFDASIHEMFATWSTGGRLILVGEETRRDPQELVRLIAEQRVEKVILPVVVLQQLAELQPWGELQSLREVTTTGEQLQVTRDVRGLFAALPECELHNHYGPSETHVVTAWQLSGPSAAWASHPVIGRPIANTQIYILDEEQQPVPVGVRGELYIGGVGLGRGYLQRPGLTAERFVPDPFAAVGGGRLYRTGDVARYRADGSIEFLGRGDHQVKVRGYRIELGEVEAALCGHSGVQEAIVVAREESSGEKRLVGYVVRVAGAPVSGSELRSYLREQLPEYMVPATVMVLERLPLTTNGKVDRRALPEPEAETGTEYEAPRTPVEEMVAGIWAEVLRLERVGIHDNFFELGGDSIQSMRVVARLNRAGLRVSLKELFDGPTVAELAAQIAEIGDVRIVQGAGADTRASASDGQTPTWMAELSEQVDDVYPLSPMQQGMLFHSIYSGDSSAYVEQFSWQLTGTVDLFAFKRAWDHVIASHPALRTGFIWQELEEPAQVVYPHVDLPFEQYDWRELSSTEQAQRLDNYIQSKQRDSGFTLSQPPLQCLAYFQLADRQHQFVWSYHHLMMDGWSQGLVLNEVREVYEALCEGRDVGAPVGRPYRQFIDWLGRQDIAGAEAYWRFMLRDCNGPTTLQLARSTEPTDRQTYEHEQIFLSEEMTSALRATARQNQLTLNTLVQGAWAILLSRYSGEEDVVFGSVTAGRPVDLAGSEATVGMFINTLPIRISVPPEAPALAWLKDLQARQAEALQYSFSPLVQVQKWSGMAPGSRLFDHFLVFQNYPGADEGAWEGIDWPALQTGYPFYLLVKPGAELSLKIVFDQNQYSVAAITRLLQNFRVLLEGVSASGGEKLGELPLLSEAERRQVLGGWEEAVRELPLEVCYTQHFEAQVERTPTAVAVREVGQSLSYEELNRRANRVAQQLREQGVGTESVVGLLARRGVAFLSGLLGILKAGGVYLPLEPSQPGERQRQVLEASQAQVVLVGAEQQAELAERLSGWAAAPPLLELEELQRWEGAAENPGAGAGAEALAYVIYTSGSTGTPKGAMIEQRGMLNHLLAKVLDLGLEERDVVAQNAAASFDISVWQYLAVLLVGGRVEVLEDEVAHDATRLLVEVERRGVTVLETVPTMLRALLDEVEQQAAAARPGLAGLRWLISNAEGLPPGLCQRWQAVYGEGRLINTWGATECSDDVTHLRVAGAAAYAGLAYVPLGRPLANVRVYVLDGQLRPVPVGVVGELCIAGVSVGRGYLNDEERTKQAFVSDPFVGAGRERLYRTGDLGRWLEDGGLEYVGRADGQVKIRGHRVELGEVESVLRQVAGVAAAVVVARSDERGEQQLVGYVELAKGAAVTVGELRSSLRSRLPEYMAPGALVVLDELPLTANGKIDKRALPAPAMERGESEVEYVGPRSPAEELLAGIWSEVLGLERVGVAENFFELGGHSLLATQVISRVRAAFGVEVPLRSLFEAPTVEELAEIVAREWSGAGSERAPRLVAVPRGARLPLSFAQQRLWFLNQLEPESAFYNVGAAVRLRGTLDVAALERTLTEIVRRHEALRTVFPLVEGQPVQQILTAEPVRLALTDLSGLPAAAREAEARRLANSEGGRPFDLAQGPLLRASLLRLSDEEHVVLLTLHHIISDGWSLGVLVREVATLYRAYSTGAPSPLAELPIQYADYAHWQREWLQGEVLDQQLDYWKQQLAGIPALLELPTDRPLPAIQSYRGARQHFALPAALAEALKELSRREGTTLFMTMLAAFQTLLYRYAGQSDICVGTPIAGRRQLETETLIGFFVNTLVLRSRLDQDQTFRMLLQQVKEVTLGAYAHQDVPFEKLVEDLQPERSLSHQPMFQVMFAVQNVPEEELRLPGLTMDMVEVSEESAKFNLNLSLWETDGELPGALEYSTDLFDAATIERMLRHFEHMLNSIVENPEQRVSELQLLDETERRQLQQEWNETGVDYPAEECLHQLFEAQVGRTPAAVALVSGAEELSYRELNERANQLAHYLQRLGVGPEVLVGICMERSVEMLVSVLAVLKSGGAYLPLDPAYPAERVSFMLGDAAVAVLLTQAHLRERLPESEAVVVCLESEWELVAEEPRVNPESGVGADNLLYVIYTSGSTGRPKGVALHHRPIVNLLSWHERTLKRGARMLQFASLSFDASIHEMFATWSTGGRLILVGEETRRDPQELVRLIAEQRVEKVILPVVVLQQLAELQPWGELQSLREVTTTGEQLQVTRDVRGLFAALPECELHNHYGPSETHVVTAWQLRGASAAWASHPVIGRPIANTQIYILDEEQQPVPVGVRGELYIGGVGLGRGYLQRPGLTAERFVPDPFAAVGGGRLYRTGDVARYRADGSIEFLGRGDHQVKVRGYRIELGEVEAALCGHSGVQEAIVVAREESSGEKRLVGYVVRVAGAPVSGSELRSYLREQLPEYMVPATVMVLERLPLTTNGKVDRRALPEPEAETGAEYEAPRTPVEEMVAGIWAEVLRLERVGIHDNFFELGGHSLLATQVMSRVREAFQVELPLRRLFEASSVVMLAAEITTAMSGAGALQIPAIVPVMEEQDLPLSFAQQRLWFLDQLEPERAFYNVPAAVRMSGSLNIAALEETLTEIVRRHEALRTVFPIKDGQPVQQILAAEPVRLEVTELSALAAAEREREARRLATAEGQRPFNLATGPLLRASVLRLAAEEHVVLLTLHHIISDGWSLGVLVQEVATLYAAYSAGEVSPLPELPIQYGDYAHWQREWLQEEVLAGQLAYWREQLAGAPAVLELPADKPRPAVQSYRGAAAPVVLSAELTAALQELSRREGATLFMTLLAGFQTLLYRYTGERDLVVGSPIANRHRVETEGLIGFFVNTLVLRARMDQGQSFRELLRQVREVTLGAYAHQDVPFDRLVEELQPERSLSRQPLFQVMFTLQNTPQSEVTLAGLTMESVEGESEVTKFDLNLTLIESEEGLSGTLEYSTDLFEAATIERIVRHFERLLESIVREPGQRVIEMEMLAEAERELVLVQWNKTEVEYAREQCVHELFEAQVERTPEAVALVSGEVKLSYRELNRRANQLAHYLQQQGIGPESLVGICVERSVEMVVSLLAVLKAGGAYLPLDPADPTERLSFMIENAAVGVVLTQPHLAQVEPTHKTRVVNLADEWTTIANQSAKNPVNKVAATNLAYVMYTSGSTGEPKGVCVPHLAVVRLVSPAKFAPLTNADRVLQLAPVAFDASTFEIWGALLAGARLVLGPAEQPTLAELAEYISAQQISTMWLTAGLFHQMVEAHLESFAGVRQLLAGGDVLSPAAVARYLQASGPGQRLVNGYGPTENTTFTCCHVMECSQEPGNSVPIGRAVAGTRVYVLDERLGPAPVGVVGELYTGGAGLARGYLGAAALTGERFVPDPFSEVGGERLYRTGDLVRWREGGELEFMGRADGQVKVRGHRVELGEVEAALRGHDGVKEAVVVVRDGAGGEKQLMGYVAGTATSGELRAYLRERLPEYMVPATVMVLERLPLTTNGKVDRRALPEPEAETGAEYEAPRTPVEEMVAGIWAEVLRLERVGIHDNFFELGGHSLLATQVMSRVREAFQVELPLRRLFEASSVVMLAAEITTAMSGAGALQIPAIVPVMEEQDLPLSFAQQRLWFLDQLEPERAFYNVPAAVRMSGPLNIAALEETLTEIVRRHEALRTVFPIKDGQPVQQILAAEPVRLEVTELSALAAAEREREARRLATAEGQRPFNLATGPLLRASVLRLAAEEHVVLLTLHHIISDGWSLGVLVQEVATLYAAYSAGEVSPLPELPIQYGDYAHWQREWLQEEVLAGQLAYWREQLAGAPAVLELPADKPRPAVQSYRGAAAPVVLSAELTAALQELSRREGATLFMTLLAGFQTLLYRYTGERDLVVGSPIANRHRVETEGLIGFFVNTLVLRARMDQGQSFRELLRQVREVTLGAYAHQDVPFDRLVEELQPERSLSRQPLFQVMFTLQNTPQSEVTLAGLTMESVEGESEVTKFDLNLTLIESEEGLSGTLEYSTDLFEAATIERIVRHFERLLEGVVKQPDLRLSDLALLNTIETHQLLRAWNETEVEYAREQCVHELFEAQVERTPEAAALVSEGVELSYRELNRRANQLAHYLQQLGVGPESLVGICVERSVEMVVSLLAVLKAGGAYVPLDPDYPQERVAFMLADAQVGVILTQVHLRETLPASEAVVVSLEEEREQLALQPDGNPVSTVESGNLAYVIYTSGSTGQPKGALITHAGLSNHMQWMQASFPLSGTDCVLQKTPFSFDASVWEFYAPLLAGARLLLARAGGQREAAYLVELIEREQVTTLQVVPMLLRMLLAEKRFANCRSLRRVFCGGEPLTAELRDQFFGQLRAQLINLYGPTETTIEVVTWVCRQTDGPVVPLGRPIANTQIYILDEELQPVPVGVRGELYIGGVGLGRGYLQRPGLTAERFVPDPFAAVGGGRLYRTGDVARYRADASVEFLGRCNHQVKVRGYRIELGEVEAALCGHSGVREAIVVAREESSGEKRLVGYVVRVAGAPVSGSELRSYLRERLPEYMVPATVMVLERLPLTTNGKVDRRALPEPEAETGAEYEAPRTPVEEMVAGIWAEVLGVERVGIHDNFFELGGHSLLATQILSRLRSSFGVELAVRGLFAEPTVAGITTLLMQEKVKQNEQAEMEQLFAELESLSVEEAKDLLIEETNR